MSERKLVGVNLLAHVEQPDVGSDPYRIGHDGQPYVPVGDGGVVLGLQLGDSVFEHVGDHAAPGVCLVHPSDDAAHALVALSCIGNEVIVRTGDALGARGVVLGKRGGGQRVLAVFTQDALRRLRPGDQVSIGSVGQGAQGPLEAITQLNIAPRVLDLLPVKEEDGRLEVGVHATLPSKVVGNGVGRPMAMWDVDLQIGPKDPAVENLRLGDLVAISDLDARYNAGFRRGWMSVGVVVHGASKQPGHGPGVTIILTGPAELFSVRVDGEKHHGLREEELLALGTIEN